MFDVTEFTIIQASGFSKSQLSPVLWLLILGNYGVCHQKSPTDYYEDINYDDFPNGSDIIGVHMASKSSKKVTFEFVLKLLSFSSDI